MFSNIFMWQNEEVIIDYSYIYLNILFDDGKVYVYVLKFVYVDQVDVKNDFFFVDKIYISDLYDEGDRLIKIL